MRFVVITGMSGAGKTIALHSLEDAGYYTVDNLPPSLLPSLIAFSRSAGYERTAVVIDTRCGAAFSELSDVLGRLNAAQEPVETFFLDAGDDVLIHRYKETRRPHPILGVNPNKLDTRSVVEAIEEERVRMQSARALADSVLDTSALTAAQLRDAVHSRFSQNTLVGMRVTITSFGFRYGLPIDADLVFDVRFLRNPHYDPELKPLDGRDKRVADYIYNDPMTEPFMERMFDLIEFALPQYRREGKAYLTIGIGCTGGQHRSVALSIDLAERLNQAGHVVMLRHRDVIQNRMRNTTEAETAFLSQKSPEVNGIGQHTPRELLEEKV